MNLYLSPSPSQLYRAREEARRQTMEGGRRRSSRMAAAQRDGEEAPLDEKLIREDAEAVAEELQGGKAQGEQDEAGEVGGGEAIVIL